jgi:hypothetical protein
MEAIFVTVTYEDSNIRRLGKIKETNESENFS